MQNEELREVLLDLKRAKKKEEALRFESETLLEGLRALTESGSSGDGFLKLLNVLQKATHHDDAFILVQNSSDQLVVMTATSELFSNTLWTPDKVLRRVLRGQSACLLSLDKVSEWRGQSAALRETYQSAVMVPFSTSSGAAVIVCVHRQTAFFSRSHIHLLERLAPLASQALMSMQAREDAARAATLERLNSELMQTQEKLRTAQQQAEAANEAKSLFLATMSHEIRSPLHVILTMNTLLQESKLTVEQREFVNLSRDGGQALMALINDILDFSKIESGKLKLHYDWFDPVKTVEQVVEQLYGRAALKDIEVVSVISPHAPQKCLGDEARLRQILINLVTNAIKFTESGGVIVRLLPTGQGIEVQVEDSGIGIAADRQETIFGEFVQVDEGNSRGFGGSGLGLSIVRRLVELMKGEVNLDSEEGIGSHFRVLLPLQVESPAGFIPLDSGQTVCLDIANPVLARGLREQISLMGGRACLLKDFQSESPPVSGKPVMLVDHIKDGLTVEDRRRRIDRLPDAGNWRLATLVDMHEIGYLEQALTDGFDAAIRKPLRSPDLQKRLFVSACHVADDGTAVGQEIPGDTSVGKGKLVLLVEDSPSIQAVTRALLARKDYDVATADHGGRAVEKAEERPFDVILMDVAMPVMDGLAATQHIRSGNGPNRQTPIIAMTANAFTEDRERCLAAGMDDFISKPLDVEKFYQLLEHWTSATITPPARKETAESENQAQEKGLLALEVLEKLVEDVSWNMLPNILSTYLRETEQRVVQATELFSNGDLNSLAVQAHTIKSGSGSLGLLKLQTLATEIELAAKRGDLPAVADAMSGLEHIAQASMSALKTFVEGHRRLSP